MGFIYETRDARFRQDRKNRDSDWWECPWCGSQITTFLVHRDSDGDWKCDWCNGRVNYGEAKR